ncbi:DKNYY domain-containing protein [Microcoleus sp. AT8-B6]|uniref:DKNYY domain-containing protein n=1 Tax=Microcoleus sp. AT8-B6 TaxID=2818622 RepID=UPI002FD03DC2
MKPLLFSITILLTACNGSVAVDSTFKQMDIANVPNGDTATFRPYKHDLFIASNGRLAYKTIDNTDPSKPEDRFVTAINTDSLNDEQKKELNEVIDTASFTHIGDLYYRDKNHVHYHVQMMDGGPFFIVWEADRNSFEVLDSSYYGKDKKKVFCRGGLMEQADAKSFKIVSQPNKHVYSWTAKDKNHSYDGGDVVNTRANK